MLRLTLDLASRLEIDLDLAADSLIRARDALYRVLYLQFLVVVALSLLPKR
jgi:hypothetical protein